MKNCTYCESLVLDKPYRVDGDGYCNVCGDKIFSDGCTVVYTGLLRGFHRFKTKGMSICAKCGAPLEEMTLSCSETSSFKLSRKVELKQEF